MLIIGELHTSLSWQCVPHNRMYYLSDNTITMFHKALTAEHSSLVTGFGGGEA